MATAIKKIKIKKRQDGKVGFLIGFLDKSVDATYIIHKLGNGRLDQVRKQLQLYQPTQTIYLVQTPGWKEKNAKKKNKHICDTARDIVDNNIHVFRHAKKHNYANILILEDDFFFKDTVLDVSVNGEINAFLKKNQDTVMCYTVGCIPFISAPCFDVINFPVFWERKGERTAKRNRILGFPLHYYTAFATTHCCIYTRPYRDKLLTKGDTYLKAIKDWDNEIIFGTMYHEPLCYQLFPETENQNGWGKSGALIHIAISFAKQLIKIIQLDKKPEPGYMITYLFSKLLFFNLLLFLAFFLGILLVLLKVDLTFLVPRFPPLYVVE